MTWLAVWFIFNLIAGAYYAGSGELREYKLWELPINAAMYALLYFVALG